MITYQHNPLRFLITHHGAHFGILHCGHICLLWATACCQCRDQRPVAPLYCTLCQGPR